MKIRFSIFYTFIVISLISLTGCVRQKDSLLSLSPRMTKREVEQVMGKPDEIRCPVVTPQGDVIDIWEYKLGTINETRLNKKTAFLFCGLFIFWPLLCFPTAWESPYDYSIYFLKFVNNLLVQWGKPYEIDTTHCLETR